MSCTAIGLLRREYSDAHPNPAPDAELNGAQDEDETVKRILLGQERLKEGMPLGAAMATGEGELKTGNVYARTVNRAADNGTSPVETLGSGASSPVSTLAVPYEANLVGVTVKK